MYLAGNTQTGFQAVNPPDSHLTTACVEVVVYPKRGFGWTSVPQTRYVNVTLNFTLVAQMLSSQRTQKSRELGDLEKNR